MFKKSKLKEINLNNLIEISKILKNFEYVIYFGTLLGITRDKEIIKGDDDIDILANIKDKKNIENIIKKSRKFLLNKKKSNDYFIQFVNNKNKIKSFIDFYFFVSNKKRKFIIEKHNCFGLINNNKFAFHIPKTLVFPLKKSKLIKDLKIPNKPVSMCKYLYGENWRKPLQKNNEYRWEIINNKPLLIKRSYLGSINRKIKNFLTKKFEKE